MTIGWPWLFGLSRQSKCEEKTRLKLDYIFLKINWILQYTKNVLICEKDKEKKHTIQNDWMYRRETNERDSLKEKLIKNGKKISTKLINAGNNLLRKEIRNFCSKSVPGEYLFLDFISNWIRILVSLFSTFYWTEMSIRSL